MSLPFSLPDPVWPPKRETDRFVCTVLRCSLTAKDCRKRQDKKDRRTGEPKYPTCHAGCAQGRVAAKARGK